MARATEATLNHVIKDAYTSALVGVLGHHRHKCGEAYRIGFLDADGSVLRRSVATDSYEATIFARCENPMCRYRSTQYNYSRFGVAGYMVSSLNPQVLIEALTHEMRRACDVLSLHLENLYTALDIELKAEIAERVTQILSRGSTALEEVGRMFELEEQLQDLGDFLESLGFVKDKRWRIPVMTRPNFVSEAQTLPAMPTFAFDTKETWLLALPAEHPLAA